MSGSVEREELDPASKDILCGEHERPESPTPCVSMKSDRSKGEPLNFSNEAGPPDKSVSHRPESPTPSCVSMKSDRSMGHRPTFSNQPGPPDKKSVSHRPESPTPSCVSMKSDRSMGHRPTFSNQPGPPDKKSVYHRPESPTPSCVSMKSGRSMGHRPTFSNQPGPPDKKPESPTPSCVSMKSDWSKREPPDFSNEPEPPDTKKRKRSGCVATEQAPMCSVCEEVLTDPVSTSCGHWFCRQCITSYWDQSAPTGHHDCPQCGQTFITTPGLKTPSPTSSGQTYVSVQEDLKGFKINLKSLDHVTDVTEVPSLSRIYTELYITVGVSEGVNNQHEVYQLETLSKKNTLHDQPIKCCDIFKPLLLGRETPIRRVLTRGIAGIGKTFSVRKFILDWANGLENQDVILLVPFSFRELNLVRDEPHSLFTLIHVFHPTLKKVTAEQLAVWKVGFIFDGLDESRLSFNFENNEIVSDVTVTSSVDRLLTNLIKGNLLPQALIWITTRPAAANQIPPAYVDMVTEIRGFTDPQKEDYFMKKFSDEEPASGIISHMKTSKSLHIMCHIPVFCWITATVLEDMVKTDETGPLPTTLTAMCCHFLLVQTKRMEQKYEEPHEGKKRKKKRKKKERDNQQQIMETDRDVLLKLGRLAFEHLEKGSIMFYEEDLKRCGLDVKEASLYSGVCTEIFKREGVLFQRAVYCFVHLIIQEFLAAVYLFHCFTQKNMEVLKTFLGDRCVSSLEDFLDAANNKAVRSKNGHLDLFLRFLHGLSLESNQSLLGGLLGQIKNSPESIQKAINNLKKMNNAFASPDRCINIFHCLMEMNDHSVHQEIQQYLKSGDRSKTKLSPTQCSALAHMLQMSVEVLEDLDLGTYNTSDEGRLRLIPAVRDSRKARLVGFGSYLRKEHMEIVASALSSNPSHLRHLDLSYSKLDLDLLCAALKSPHCRLEILRLVNCWLSERSCEVLASALKSNPSHLRELDLNFNVLPVSGLKNFSGLESLHVKHGGELWTNPQLLTRYFHRLTLDPNTANRTLCLSENNRKVTGAEGEELQAYPGHPDRFDDKCPQILCTEGLTGCCYWEVETGGMVEIGVAYRGISRSGEASDLGHNDVSWSLYSVGGGYDVYHNSRRTHLPVVSSVSNRVAVYVDCPAGTLSFYDVSSDSLTHLYTFQSTFTEPLYPGFRLPYFNASTSSVCLCEDR